MRKEEDCSSLLYRIRPSGPMFKFYPHRATLNYYIGCSHNCQYCYARYTMKNVGWEPDDFGRNICIKANAAEVLEKELQKKTWKQTYNGIIQGTGLRRCLCHAGIHPSEQEQLRGFEEMSVGAETGYGF